MQSELNFQIAKHMSSGTEGTVEEADVNKNLGHTGPVEISERKIHMHENILDRYNNEEVMTQGI